MKSHILSIAVLLSTLIAPYSSAPIRAAEQPRRSEIDETTRFIFYSVLEGLYEDGLSKEDVAQILMKRPGSTFGPGLTKELHDQLYSKDAAQRLTAINSLVKSWMERRMKTLRLSADEQRTLTERLELKREEGMKMLESFRKKQHGDTLGVEQAAPAYVNLNECAVCNGAVGKPMKLPER